MQTLSPNHPKIIPKSSQIYPKLIPKFIQNSSPNRPRFIQDLFQIYPQIIDAIEVEFGFSRVDSPPKGSKTQSLVVILAKTLFFDHTYSIVDPCSRWESPSSLRAIKFVLAGTATRIDFRTVEKYFLHY